MIEFEQVIPWEFLHESMGWGGVEGRTKPHIHYNGLIIDPSPTEKLAMEL